MSKRPIARASLLVSLNAALASRAWAQGSPAPTSVAPAPADSAAAAPTTSAPPASPAEVELETPPAPPPQVNHSAPRVRFDVLTGHQLNLVWCCSDAPGEGGFGLLGLTLDLGVQWGDHVATYARVGASTTIVSSVGSAYLMTEWTPVRRFSIGTGIGSDGVINVLYSANGWWGISVPISLAWNLGKIDATTAHRSVFRIGVEGAIGWGPTWGISPPGATGVGVHLGYTVGWAWM